MMRSFFQSKWFTMLVLVALVLAGFALAGRLPVLVSLRQERVVVDERLAKLETSQIELTAKKEFMASETYQERQARLTLNYKKPGEQVVYVYYPESATSSPLPSSTSMNDVSWWSRLMAKILRE